MKKLLLFTVYCLLFTWSALAYTSGDVANARLLANKGIIVAQSTTAGYRLDDTITRAEATGIALKVKWIILPEKYMCKNYFTDVKYNPINNWICRAVELAADAVIISRINTKFRPHDTITRAEALAILMSSRWIVAPSGATLPIFPYSDVSESWQRDMVLWAANLKIIINPNIISWDDGFWLIDKVAPIPFYPNRSATRAEVFAFVNNILPLSQKITEENNGRENLWWGYEKDGSHVYLNGKILPNIDPVSFQFFEHDYLSDKSGVFKYFRDNDALYKIPNLEKETLKILNAGFVKDSKNAYHCDGFGVLIGDTNGYKEREFTCKKISVDIETFFCQWANAALCEDKNNFYDSFDGKTKKEDFYRDILLNISSDTEKQTYLIGTPGEITPIEFVSDLSKKYSDVTQKKIIKSLNESLNLTMANYLEGGVVELESIQIGTMPTTKTPIKLRPITNTVIVIKAESWNKFDRWLEADFIHKIPNWYEIFTSKIDPYWYRESAEKILWYTLNDVLESPSKLSALFAKTLELYFKDFASAKIYNNG